MRISDWSSDVCSSDLLAYLLTHLDGVKQVARGWRARCPNCGGSTLELAISIGGGGAELQCWGGCTEKAGLEAVPGDARPARGGDGGARAGSGPSLLGVVAEGRGGVEWWIRGDFRGARGDSTKTK